MKSYSDFGIEIPYRRTTGNVKCFCPQCRDKRSNKRDKSLSVNLDRAVWHCHYCGWSGSLEGRGDLSAKPRKEYKRPAPRPITTLSRKLVDWFNGRGISETTLQKMRICEGKRFMPQAGKEMNTVQFCYYLNDELINVKYRTGDKKFMLEQGAELIPYNIDNIAESNTCIVTEGEMDTLSFVEIGHLECVSVPNGANNNLSYLDDFIDGWFEDKETIYIAVDTDSKGLKLQEELVRRFGSERCKIVTYGDDCKDANEHLQKYGKESLERCLNDAKEVKVDGVFSMPDYERELDYIYQNGLKKGFTIGHLNFDKLCSFETKRLAIVTGIPGCVVGDTMVKTTQGYKRMEDVTTDDYVVCYDTNGNVCDRVVLIKWNCGEKMTYLLETRKGIQIEASATHRFLTPAGGYVELGKLKVGDIIAREYLQWDEICSITECGVKPTFDIEVDEYHNYVANGLITHNSGKSEFIDEMCVRMNLLYDYKVGFFSPENMPIELHAVKLIEKICGGKLQQDDGSGHCIPASDYREAKDYMADNFFHILPADGYTIENILAKAKYLVRRRGIKILVIDPFNRIESGQNAHESETQYISRVLDSLTNFAQQNDVLVFLMAHPRKINKNENNGIPTLYDINGSANFFNKADFGIVVHRIRDSNDPYTMVLVEKVKFRHLGECGKAYFKFNLINGRYVPYDYSAGDDKGSDSNYGYQPQYDNNNYLKHKPTIPNDALTQSDINEILGISGQSTQTQTQSIYPFQQTYMQDEDPFGTGVINNVPF